MSKRNSSKNDSRNCGRLREVVKIIDTARKRLRNNSNTSHPIVILDLIRGASKFNAIIKTSKK
jgi:hypothetical protein